MTASAVRAAISSGSPGDPLILGQSNDAGTTNTTLVTNTSGNAQHLRVERDGVRAIETRAVGLVHDRVCRSRLIAHGSNGSLQDVSLAAHRVT
jgi:hypothetical protein